jgi:hypothetical protein
MEEKKSSKAAGYQIARGDIFLNINVCDVNIFSVACSCLAGEGRKEKDTFLSRRGKNKCFNLMGNL